LVVPRGFAGDVDLAGCSCSNFWTDTVSTDATPNSYNGIFWVLGRYDRPSAPTRPVFGTVLYMSSENTARKFSMKSYIKKYDGKAKQASLKF